jgi:hypothetical protein
MRRERWHRCQRSLPGQRPFSIRPRGRRYRHELRGQRHGDLSSDNFFDAGKYSIDSASFCESRFQPMPEAPTRVVIAGEPLPGADKSEKPDK